ncbi:hypothetical protein DEO72_LG6g176 [Vigna unguiculata]|uniref:GRF-type domain-containing protein n=1 Tax=Vigna unguiculata TaxID=3917 RepID=A0A4D6M405_VIGUN|nr:hypothetical protein DEO72_LG6g176 [Vigna unguiculata]
MSRGFSHPLSSCSCGSRNHSVSSPGTVSGSVSGTPHCHCGEIAVLRVARTAKNCGKQFWGCPHYKISKPATTSNGAQKIMGMKEMQPLLDKVKEYVNWRKI